MGAIISICTIHCVETTKTDKRQNSGRGIREAAERTTTAGFSSRLAVSTFRTGRNSCVLRGDDTWDNRPEPEAPDRLNKNHSGVVGSCLMNRRF